MREIIGKINSKDYVRLLEDICKQKLLEGGVTQNKSNYKLFYDGRKIRIKFTRVFLGIFKDYLGMRKIMRKINSKELCKIILFKDCQKIFKNYFTANEK